MMLLEDRETQLRPARSTARPLVASVVVPVRGRPELLATCLEGLVFQTLAADRFEILVVDDGSKSEDAGRIADLVAGIPNARYLRQEPRGPAAARNTGTRAARAEVIAFLDSDTLPQPDWLENLLVPFDQPAVIAVEGSVQPPRPATSPLEEAPINEGGAHLTANMAYRRDVLLTVGGMDESFPLAAFEDVDLALAARKHGRIVFCPKAQVVHPWRRMDFSSSMRRLRQWDWLLVTALRHGCLGWEDRPTQMPRLRIALAAAITLPFGRFEKGLRYLTRSPVDALIRMGLAIAESTICIFLAPRWLFGRYPVERGRYLGGPTA